MRVIILFAILGLSLAGFRADMDKMFGWFKRHGKVIGEVVKDAVKVGSWVVEHVADDAFVDMDSLADLSTGEELSASDFIHPVDLTTVIDNKLVDVHGLIQDSELNAEELFHWGKFLDNAGKVASIVETGVNIGVKIAGAVADAE